MQELNLSTTQDICNILNTAWNDGNNFCLLVAEGWQKGSETTFENMTYRIFIFFFKDIHF